MVLSAVFYLISSNRKTRLERQSRATAYSGSKGGSTYSDLECNECRVSSMYLFPLQGIHVSS